MKILFYRYGSICEPDVMAAFEQLSIEITTAESPSYKNRKKNTSFTMSDSIDEVSRLCRNNAFLFVFSINFFPEISELCNILQIPYVCWTVDAPVIELFSPQLTNKWNRIFLFDQAQYLYFKPRNPENIFYLPLASNVQRMTKTIQSSPAQRLPQFSADISFIGSLYTDKNPYEKIRGLSEHTKGYVDGIIAAQSKIYGYNFIQEMLNDSMMEEFKRLVPDLTQEPYKEAIDAKYVMANDFIGIHLSCKERLSLLSAVSEKFAFDLYTGSDPAELPKAHFRGLANTLTEMPLVFHQSKVNLNITIRPIQTGLSLRVYDVMACGGFLLTNFQNELPELYSIGEEVETFSSEEELLEKADFYLRNDSLRQAIAQKGYERTLQCHTWGHRVAEMIRMLNK